MTAIAPRILQSRRSPHYFSYAVIVGSLIVTIELKKPMSEDAQSRCIHAISQYMQHVQITNMHSFEQWSKKLITVCDLPQQTSYAIGYIYGDVLYIQTKGTSVIFLYRDNAFVTLLIGERSASGYLKVNDRLAFASELCVTSFTQERFKEYLSGPTVDQNEIEAYLTEHPIEGSAICVFVRDLGVLQPTIPSKKEPEEVAHHEQNIQSRRKSVWERLQSGSPLSSEQLRQQRKKAVLFLVLLVIAVLLIWSVGSGYQRRTSADEIKKINELHVQVNQKLQQAQNSVTGNPELAMQSLTDAKNQVAVLVQTLRYEKQNATLQSIQKSIDTMQQQLMRRDQSNASPFVDLAVETKNASGKSFFISDDTLNVLDINNTTVYEISIPDKSINRVTVPLIGSNQQLLVYNKKIYLFEADKGLFAIEGNTQTQRVSPGADWSSVVDTDIFNGNLYVLNAGAARIEKYISVDAGPASTPSAYLTGATSLSDAKAMAIDGSIYITLPQTVLKYTGGIQQDFTVQFPGVDQASFTKTIASQDVDSVFIWDKAHGLLYEVKKDGTYMKQLSNNIFSKANDIAVYKTQLFVLVGSTVYSVDF